MLEVGNEDHERLETAHWLTPLPVDGLLTLVCAWPEIGLPETRTDIILPELAVRAAETFHCGISQRMLIPAERQHLRTFASYGSTSWARMRARARRWSREMCI